MWEDDESQMPGAELVRRPACEGRLWKTVEDVELATLSWVHWRNHNCLYGYLDDQTLAGIQ